MVRGRSAQSYLRVDLGLLSRLLFAHSLHLEMRDTTKYGHVRWRRQHTRSSQTLSLFSFHTGPQKHDGVTISARKRTENFADSTVLSTTAGTATVERRAPTTVFRTALQVTANIVLIQPFRGLEEQV
jgi:hypothetical protein